MNKQRVSEMFSNDRFTLYTVESIEVVHNKSAAGFTWHGTVKPTAIIIHSPGKNQALDMNAIPIELELLKKNIPDLDRIKGL